MKSIYNTGWILLCAVLLVGAASTISQVFRTPEVKAQSAIYSTSESSKELEDKIQLFFDDILNANPSKAFDDLLRSGTGPLGTGSGTESVAAMKTKLEEMKKQFGDFKAYDRIDFKPIGKDLVLIRYLLKCDSHPVVWTFTFYRRPLGQNSVSTTTNPWFVIGLRFDSNLDLLTL